MVSWLPGVSVLPLELAYQCKSESIATGLNGTSRNWMEILEVLGFQTQVEQQGCWS